MFVFRAFVRNMQVPDQTASSQKESDLGLPFLSWPFWQATGVQNIKTFTVHHALNFLFVTKQNNLK